MTTVNKGGRPKKYGQDTVRVSLRIPADIAEGVREAMASYQAELGTVNPTPLSYSECIVLLLRKAMR